MRSTFLRWLFFFVLCSVVIVLNSKSIDVTKKDEHFIQAFSRDWNLVRNTDSIHASFESEINFITILQNSVLKEIRHEEIPHQYFGDIDFYYSKKAGFCYDRAVLMEKFLLYHGFSFRHLYLYYGSGKQAPAISDFFKRGIASHALLEVKTKKGWMVMGTNANWLGLSKTGEVMDMEQLRNKIGLNSLSLKSEASIGKCFWLEKGAHFRYIYGVYSRHGDFFNHPNSGEFSAFSFHLLPDYNLPMLFSNL